MYKSLMPDLLKINSTPLETIAFAKKHGFDAVEFRMRHEDSSVNQSNAKEIKQAMQDAGVKAGGCNLLTGVVSAPQNDWDDGIKTLGQRAEIAAELGFTRNMIVILPFHETLTFEQCWDLHVSRMQEADAILSQFGIRIAMEYISPYTRRASFEMKFIYDMKNTLKLLAEINRPCVGLMLDSMHWFCASESVADITALTNEQVVAVHVNDAIANRPVDEQSAFERDLPGETGVIDLEGFHEGLRAINYDGPVTCEPLHPTQWTDRDPDELLSKLSECMDKYLLAPQK